MLLKVLRLFQLLLTDLYVKALRRSYSQHLTRVSQSTLVLRQHDEFRKVLAEQAVGLVQAAGRHNEFVSKELTSVGR